MSAHLRGLGETLATFLASERFLSGVSPHVVVQRRCPSKRAWTETTFKWAFVVVGHHMSSQFCGVSKRHTTMAALKGVVCLAWAYMKSQRRTLCKSLLALTTFPDSNFFFFQNFGIRRWMFVCRGGHRWYGEWWRNAVKRDLSTPVFVVNTWCERLTYFRRKLTWHRKMIMFGQISGWSVFSEMIGIWDNRSYCDVMLHSWNCKDKGFYHVFWAYLFTGFFIMFYYNYGVNSFCSAVSFSIYSIRMAKVAYRLR